MNVEEAAIKFVRLRDRHSELRKQRISLSCERGNDSDECWKAYTDGQGNPIFNSDGSMARVGDDDGWCGSCRKRQAVHNELIRTSAMRGAALRTLVRVARKAAMNGEPK